MCRVAVRRLCYDASTIDDFRRECRGDVAGQVESSAAILVRTSASMGLLGGLYALRSKKLRIVFLVSSYGSVLKGD